jgi:hypothetical protein
MPASKQRQHAVSAFLFPDCPHVANNLQLVVKSAFRFECRAPVRHSDNRAMQRHCLDFLAPRGRPVFLAPWRVLAPGKSRGWNQPQLWPRRSGRLFAMHSAAMPRRSGRRNGPAVRQLRGYRPAVRVAGPPRYRQPGNHGRMHGQCSGRSRLYPLMRATMTRQLRHAPAVGLPGACSGQCKASDSNGVQIRPCASRPIAAMAGCRPYCRSACLCQPLMPRPMLAICSGLPAPPVSVRPLSWPRYRRAAPMLATQSGAMPSPLLAPRHGIGGGKSLAPAGGPPPHVGPCADFFFWTGFFGSDRVLRRCMLTCM